MTSELPNASSINPLNTPSYQDVYGDLTDDETAAYKMLTEGSMLPEGFRDIEVWRDFADSMDEVFGDTVGSLVRDLFGMNDVGYVTQAPTIDKSVVLMQAKKLGITSDLNIFDIADVRSFVRNTPEFWKEKGGRNFIQYMSYVVNALIDMKYLWSEDYDLFLSEGAAEIGTPVYAGGTFYPTSHVYIVYDVNKFRGSVNANFSSQDALTKFFYSIAPIHLVIKSFLLSLVVDTDPLIFAISSQERVYDSKPTSYTENRVAGALTSKLNKLDKGVQALIMNDSRTAFAVNGQSGAVRAVASITTPSYFEFRINSISGSSPRVGLSNVGYSVDAVLGATADSWTVRPDTGAKLNASSAAFTSALNVTDVYMIAVNPATGRAWWGRNGNWIGSGNPATGANPTFSNLSAAVWPTIHCDGNTAIATLSLASTEQVYAAPVGFSAVA